MKYDWSSSSAYLPMVGMTLVLCYLLKRQKKDWLKRTLLVSVIFMVVPVLCSAFTLFTDPYCRWYNMPILLFALASAKVLENRKEYPITKTAIFILGFLIVCMIGFTWWNTYRFQIIYVEKVYLIQSIIALLGVVFTGIIVLIKNEKVYEYSTLFLISVFAIFTTAYTCYLYQDCRQYSSEEFEKRIQTIQKVCDDYDRSTMSIGNEEGAYRFTSTDNIVPMEGNVSGIGAFSNTVSSSIFELWSALGENRRVYCPDIPVGFEELTSAKYSVNKVEDTYYIEEKEGILPIGFGYTTYMTEKYFKGLPKELRAIAMLASLVVDEEEEKIVAACLEKYNPNVDGVISIENVDDFVDKHSLQIVSDFTKEDNRFWCEYTAEEEQYLFFSVPYEKGWRAYVNGEEVSVLNINGLMAILVMKRQNQVKFEYCNVVLQYSKWISIFACLIIGGILISNRIRKTLSSSKGWIYE